MVTMMMWQCFFKLRKRRKKKKGSDIAYEYITPFTWTALSLLMFQSIYKEHGVLGLWRGVNAAAARVTVGSAAQLSTFSSAKEFIEGMKVWSYVSKTRSTIWLLFTVEFITRRRTVVWINWHFENSITLFILSFPLKVHLECWFLCHANDFFCILFVLWCSKLALKLCSMYMTAWK